MFATFVRRSFVVILAVTAMPALAQTTISGTVRDDRNAPLAGATISVRGSHVSAVTNDAGRYRLVVPPELRDRGDSLTLLARRIGFEAGTRPVALSGSSTDVDVVLKVSTLRLESVVVTGTAAASERRRLGSSAAVDRAASAA